jgi:hypothetical protein
VTKRKMLRMILDLQQQVGELDEMLHRHATDCTRHATPQTNAPSCRPVAPTVTCSTTTEEASRL